MLHKKSVSLLEGSRKNFGRSKFAVAPGMGMGRKGLSSAGTDPKKKATSEVRLFENQTHKVDLMCTFLERVSTLPELD
jgi:hypothetical protein